MPTPPHPSPLDRNRRLFLGAVLGATAATVWPFGNGSRAAEPLYQGPLFDAHLHYNDDAQEPYPVPAVLERLRRSGVKGALVNSRPNDGTAELVKHGQEAGIHWVPFVRPYRDRDDYRRWFAEPAIADFVERHLARSTASGPYRGIGEFHLYNNADANGPVARRLVQLARQRGLVVFAHCDDVAIDRLMAHAPGVALIWAHTGIGGTPPERVAELLQRYPSLHGELSYRPGLTGDDGRLSPAWRTLMERWPQRFLAGSDTWVNGRWERYAELIHAYRVWLAGLEPTVARRIAWDNAAALFQLPG